MVGRKAAHLPKIRGENKPDILSQNHKFLLMLHQSRDRRSEESQSSGGLKWLGGFTRGGGTTGTIECPVQYILYNKSHFQFLISFFVGFLRILDNFGFYFIVSRVGSRFVVLFKV